ncbi:MAG TPA: crosslink repair DNA glycosylase YcaQ family protein [Longimicrobiaceae bacterium]|nr:crosslink repair DNA glycosylase YcaQ family protein [Longimicrobiaceae bacterium]
MLRLTKDAARALMLAAQGLHRTRRPRARKADVLAAIRRMGALQIDTIQVIARSPYLVLWSRLGPYQPRWLDELLAEGAIFEYWAHEACFLPIEDYPLYRHRMLDPSGMGWKYRPAFMEKHREEAERLLAHVRQSGAVRSVDFERREGGSGWWEWKPEKRMLEGLFTAGELMIARRERFQRVYDVRERVHPSWDDRHLPPRAEVDRALVLRAVRALGVARARWVADYFRMSKAVAAPLPERLADEGALERVRVEGWEEPLYVHPDHRELARDAAEGRLKPTATTLLSPFDPIVWDRARCKELFGFDYRLECYTPAPKRRYGYFTLPILHRGALVGRLDPKAHRQEGVFEVRVLHLEPGVRLTRHLAEGVARALRECAAWHGTPEVVVRHSDPPGAAALLQEALR